MFWREVKIDTKYAGYQELLLNCLITDLVLVIKKALGWEKTTPRCWEKKTNIERYLDPWAKGNL